VLADSLVNANSRGSLGFVNSEATLYTYTLRNKDNNMCLTNGPISYDEVR
jgi:hypothetical protein